MEASASTTLASILPAHVAVSCTSTFVHGAVLSADEEEYLREATDERRREFSTGRTCALFALRELGIDLPHLGRNSDRTPKWPEGVAGSITHCRGLCAAAVSLMSATRGLGIDAEINEPLSPGLLQRIASPAEQLELQLVETRTGVYRFTDRTLFSAKESIYKALFPIVGYHFGFEEVELRLDAGDGRFRAELAPTLQDRVGLEWLDGCYRTTPSHTMTAVHLNACGQA